MAAAVQFYGKSKVKEAYDNRGIEAWALLQQKQLLSAGNDGASLDTFLDMLDGSSAIYTLRVYKTETEPDYITDKTECNGSFNFKLLGEPTQTGNAAAMGGVGAPARYADPIYAKLQGIINEEVSEAIDKRLNGSSGSGEDSWNEVIMGYVNDPERLQQAIPVIQAIGEAIGKIFRPAAVQGPVSLAGMEQPPARRVGVVQTKAAPAAAELPNGVSAEQMRMFNVITRLEKADSDILEHLEKIADIAENNPSKYKMALSFL